MKITSKKSFWGIITAAVFAVALTGGIAAPASAQVAPPAPTNCSVQLSGSATSAKVSYGAHVYNCSAQGSPKATSIHEYFQVQHGNTIVKTLTRSCNQNNISTCLNNAFSYSTTSTSGSKSWDLYVTVQWYGLISDGTPISSYSDSFGMTS